MGGLRILANPDRQLTRLFQPEDRDRQDACRAAARRAFERAGPAAERPGV